MRIGAIDARGRAVGGCRERRYESKEIGLGAVGEPMSKRVVAGEPDGVDGAFRHGCVPAPPVRDDARSGGAVHVFLGHSHAVGIGQAASLVPHHERGYAGHGIQG